MSSRSFRRIAAPCTILVLLLTASAVRAQQLSAASDNATTSSNAVAGVRAFSSTAAAIADDTGRQDPQPTAPPQIEPKKKTGARTAIVRFVRDIGRDQAGMWTSPFRLKRHDLVWLIPVAGATAAAIATDARAVRDINPKATYVKATRRFTITGYPITLLGASGATFFIGRATHNNHLKETGALGTEAILDSMLIVDALKIATNRERPDQGTGQGYFWPHGFNAPYGRSFPSGHAAASWALARVVAGEYPNPAVKIVGYSLASLVSVARVTGRKHFPSDSLVGSVVGYLIGDYVVRHRASNHEHAWSWTVVPYADARTHTRGVTLSFSPGN